MRDQNVATVAPLVAQLSAVVEDIQARNTQSTRQIQTSVVQLNQSARQLQSGADDFVQQVTQAVSQQTRQALVQGMGDALEQFEQGVGRSIEQAKWATDALGEQRKLITRAQSALVWKGLIALALGLVMMAGGSVYVAWDRARQLEQSGQALEVAQLLQSQTLVRCGSGWCAKVKMGKGAVRYGDKGEYVQVGP